MSDTRTWPVYKAAHLLPDGPYSEAEIAELLQALFHIRTALGPEHLPQGERHGMAYEEAWAHIHDRRAAE